MTGAPGAAAALLQAAGPTVSVQALHAHTMMPNSLIAATATHDYPIDLAQLRIGLAGAAEVEEVALPYGFMTEDEERSAAERLATAAGLLVRIGYVRRGLIEALPRLRVITLHGVGVDQVDVAAARERGIVVTNVPGANAQAVAELTIALMLAVYRRICVADRKVRAGDWAGARTVGEELQGKTLGIVGLGNIGRRVARLGRAFGMEVLAYAPRPAQAEEDARLVDLDTLLRSADVVSLHAPQTAETTGLIDAGKLALMKPTAILVNTARGLLVDEAALVDALRRGRLAGAGLDVHAQEPPDPGNPLLTMDRVVLTPHVASSTRGALARIALRAGEDMARVLRGEEPLHPVW